LSETQEFLKPRQLYPAIQGGFNSLAVARRNCLCKNAGQKFADKCMRSLMRSKLVFVLLAGLTTVVSCKTNNPTQPSANAPQASEASASPATEANQPLSLSPAETATAKPSVDACALISGQEIESVQGESVKETKLSGQSTGGFTISQCFFTLPTFTNSISLMVAQKGEGTDARDPKDFWRSTFHDKKEKAGERKKGEEKEESAPPQRVSGIGDEAFWLGNQVSGALYVLKGNSYVRISIGGPSNEASKRRSKTLAQKAIARL
jgi:hypothetical protein